MTRRAATPSKDPRGLRQRARADGSLRVWWEPRPEDRKAGFQAQELDANRMNWSRDEARRLNAAADAARATGTRATAPRAQGRTIDDLIASYRRSVHFQATLRPKTRASYTALLSQIATKWGTRRVVEFDKATMATWYQTLFAAKGPRMAQALIRMMSVLFAHAETELGWRPENSNPCTRLKIHTPPPRQRAATWAEFDALDAAARRLGLRAMALALRLSLFQGQRATDVMRATRGAFRLLPVAGPDGTAVPTWVWFFRRSKRDNDGVVTVHPEVIADLRAALATARPETEALIVDEATGRAYDEHLFTHRFMDIRAEAAKALPSVASLQFRDLRRTFGVLARSGGASKDDTADVLGNSAATNPLLGETYMPPSFTTASRAVLLIARPEKPSEPEDERKQA